MEEKKLTDAEIVKALNEYAEKNYEHCSYAEYVQACGVYCNHKKEFIADMGVKNGEDCRTCDMSDIVETAIVAKQTLDIIHRLQSENAEYKRKLADGELCSMDYHNEQMGVLNCEIETYKAAIERLKEEKKTLVWLNQDLEKQVDEQENEIDRLEKVVHEQAEQYYNLEQRTAVEILQRGRYCMPSGLRDWIKERYGVEVDE